MDGLKSWVYKMSYKNILTIIKGLAISFVALFIYRSGENSERLKQKEKVLKQNEKHNKNRKIASNLSRSELLEHIHRK